MFGSRYYNAEECWSTSYLSEFSYTQDPLKTPDQMVKMTMKVKKTNAIIDVGAFFTSKDKASLADSHSFFKGISNLKKQEKKYFPQKMDCFKEVNNWLFGFGFYDVYGIAFQLNPTIDEYTKSSSKGNKDLDFIDLFSIFLDIFRGFKVLFKENYYVGNFGDDDIGINLFTEEDGSTTVQGRIRTLHDFKKGNHNEKCLYQNMSNYKKNKELYLSKTGKTSLPKSNIERCQGLNIAGALDVFEEYAGNAVRKYHSGKDSFFSHCFNEKYSMTSRCPEPLKPIWNDPNHKYLYRSIRNTVLKWTTTTMINHLISMFEILRDQEISRLSAIEVEKLRKLEKEKKEQEKVIKETQKKLVQMMIESVKKAKSVVISPEDEEIRKISNSDDISIRPIKKKTSMALKSEPSPNIEKLDLNRKMTGDMTENHERSETASDFIKNFNIEYSINSSNISETVIQEEKIIESEMIKEQNRIREAMKDILNEKLIKYKDLDQDIAETGEVKNGYKNIVETAENAILLEEQKEQIMKKVVENLEDQINVAKDTQARKKKLERMDSIEEIMIMKKNIDILKEDISTNENKRKLDNDIEEINKKLDEAIVKYGSDKQIVDTKQVIITLGSLKRELDPFYLKSKVKNYGTLSIQNQQNDFIFL